MIAPIKGAGSFSSAVNFNVLYAANTIAFSAQFKSISYYTRTR